jgi:SAM-dependent methyltransferase
MWPPRYGRPIDRHYIDGFLAAEAASIRGDVLEVGDLDYTNRFGGADVVSRSTLHAPAGAGPGATYVADLADAPELPDGAFDCIVLPQTLLFIYDVAAAVATLHRILRPGGVALVTVPGITQSVPDDKELWGQYWSFTDDSLHRLFGDVFGGENVEVTSRGNVAAAVAFLHGLVVDDLRPRHLEVDDPAYPLILTVKAHRPQG